MLVYFVANWYICHYTGIRFFIDMLYRAVKMSILALYLRIVSGKRGLKQGLPWIVQPRAVWWIAGAITFFHIAVFLVSNCPFVVRSLLNVISDAIFRMHSRFTGLGCHEAT